jgi:hypothetical protein
VIDIGRERPAGEGVRKRRRRPARFFRHCALALAVLGLAGCVTQGPRTMTVKQELAPTDSFARMWPGGPATVSVIEKRYRDAIVRETILATNSRVSGQNFIMVTLYGQSDYVTVNDNALGQGSIQPGQIAREFQWYLLGVPMRTSNLYAQNKYGPFGFAIGTARSGDRCIYGWQHLSRSRFLENGAIGIRLRICDRTATEQELLAMMYRFDIVGYLRSRFWNPYGNPPAVSSSLGEMSSPVVPQLTTTAPARTSSPPRRVVIREPQPVRPIQGPIVPLPGGSGNIEEVPVVPLPN